MSRADKRPRSSPQPERRRVEAVIAQYIYDLTANPSRSQG